MPTPPAPCPGLQAAGLEPPQGSVLPVGFSQPLVMGAQPYPRGEPSSALLPGAFTASVFPRGTGVDKQTGGHKNQSKLIHRQGGPLPGVLMRSSLYNEHF